MQKIIIFTSPGGGGHMSASNALESYLKDQYEVEQIFLLEDLLKNFDPFQCLTLGLQTGEGIYNKLMYHKQWWLINIIYFLGRFYFKPFQPFMRKKIIAYLKNTNADMVISVIPIFNNIIMQAAEDLDIPFLLMPTDLDIRSFVYNIKNPWYKKFHLSIIYNEQNIKKNIKTVQIQDHFVSYNGFPLRQEFFESKNSQELRANMGIQPEVPIIMLMMGLQGAHTLVSCVDNLKNIQAPIHLLVCIGKNKAITGQLESIPLPSWTTMSIIEQTPYISNLMAISTLIITKAGSASFSEAINMELPMIIDGTSGGLIWERFNHEFTGKNGLGVVISDYKQLTPYITEFLQDQTHATRIKNNLKKFHQKDTPKKITLRIASMLYSSYQYEGSTLALVKKT